MNLRVSLGWLYGKDFFNLLAKTLLGTFLCISGVEALNARGSWADEQANGQISGQISEQSREQIDGSANEQMEPVTADDWLSRLAQTALQEITDVQVTATDAGFELILETVGTLPEPSTSTTGNALIIEIPNAVLALPEGEPFQQFSPAEGIALVQVSNTADSSVEIAITGADAPPMASVSSGAVGFALSVTPGIETVGTDGEAIQLSVTGEQDEGYNPPDATTATRTDTPLRDIPQSIQVIPRQVIEDQGITRIGDAIRNVSGVTPQRDFGGSNFRFTTRGFGASRILRNGFRSGDRDFSVATATNTIERIEVPKGPASVLYGQVEPGGVVNLITKQPLDEPLYDLQFRAGSFGFIEPSLDFTGPLTEDGRLTYRLTASYQNGGNFRDFADSEIISISPVISYDFSENTNLTFEYEYLEDNQTFNDGLPIDPVVFDLPREQFLGEPDDFFNSTLHRFFLTLNHRFSENIRLRSGFGAELGDDLQGAFRPQVFDPESGDLSRDYSNPDSFNDNFSWQTDLISEFKTGPVEHQLLAGFELSRATSGVSAPGFLDLENRPLIIVIAQPG